MAYLTEYSFNQLSHQVEIKNLNRITLEVFKKKIIKNDRLYYLLNQFDLKLLLSKTLLLDNDKSFILTYKEVPDRLDNLNFILTTKGKVKYHKHNKCKALNNGFQNFNMPEPVIELEKTFPEEHEQMTQKVRDWFVKNQYDLTKYKDNVINDEFLTNEFNKIFPVKYNIEPISKSSNSKNNFRWYEERKGDITNIKDVFFNIEVFNSKIEEILKKREHICNSKTMYSLSKYDLLHKKNQLEINNYINEKISKGYLKNVSPNFIQNYGIEKLVKFWKEHYLIRNDAKNLLNDYIKWTYNLKDKSFDEISLMNFNLEQCRLCH